jgi:hypothetical protein
VKRRLPIGKDFKLIASAPDIRKDLKDALQERSKKFPPAASCRDLFKLGKTSNQNEAEMAYRADLKKRGATKPRIAHQELFKGLLQRQNEISRERGIGNAVTGMKFQSVVLG